MMKADQFTCGGCGATRREAASGGMWIMPGSKRAIQYLLCDVCAAAMQNDPQRMLEVIEQRLMRAQGNA
jgi:hypothetical protein